MFRNNCYTQTLSHLKILPELRSDYRWSLCDMFLFWTWFVCNTKVFILCETVLQAVLMA